ncbi:MAG: hypothetical protein K8S25_03635 [Alphaproteobacteria bacterium]|nr:hypothetical protein [Alphaproteobacteria bacterium]
MSETTARSGSRWRNLLIMLPFFLLGVAVPVYFYGFSGNGPPQEIAVQDTLSPAPAAEPGEYSPGSERSFERSSRDVGVVTFVRQSFDGIVDTYVSPDVSPLMIKLGTLAALFVGGFVLLRVIIGLVTGVLGGVIGFLIHKAAGPMFMGFLAVGSTWGIHQTVAEQFGLSWAATSVSLTAAIATLFALAGIRVRA